MPYLALILLFPWFAILAALYWIYPRSPRTHSRRLFDAVVLAIALVGSIAGMNWGYAAGKYATDTMWKQILAALIAFGVFHAVLAIALLLRPRLLRG